MADNIESTLDLGLAKDALQRFFAITGMVVSFSFPKRLKENADVVLQNTECGFCRIIQSSPEGLERCRLSHRERQQEMAFKQVSTVTTCHSGLTGISVPVFIDRELHGVLYAGGILTHKPDQKRFYAIREDLRGLNIDMVELEKAYFAIPVVNKQALEMALELLVLIANCALGQGQITSQEDRIRHGHNQAIDGVVEGANPFCDRMPRLRMQLPEALNARHGRVCVEGENPRHCRIAKQALAFIDANYSENLTLEDVARHVQLSPSYLSLLFHRECGCTFISYLRHRRISIACQLLQDLQLTVADVAARVGYSNIGHFYNLFRKVTGLTPGGFREAFNFNEYC